MTRRILAGTGITLAVLLVTVILLLGWLTGTQSGTRALWSGVSGAVDGLSVESVEGRIGGPLSLQGLRFETEFLRLTIGSLQLDWSPSALFGGEVLLDRLHVGDVAYTQLKPAPPSEDSDPFSLPEELSLPVAIELRDIVLRSFEYRSAPDATPVRVDEVALAASFRGTEVSIDHLSAYGPLFRVEAVASARTRDDYSSTLSLDWQASPPDLAPLSGQLSVAGDLALLRVEQTIDAPYNSSQRIEVRDVLGDELRIDARVEINDTQLQAIRETLPAAAVSGTLLAEGSVGDLSYRADLDVDSAEFGTLALLASGGFSDQVVALEQMLLTREPGDARLAVAGRADISGPTPTFDLQGDWRDLVWPLVGEPRINSGTGRFTVNGSAEDYTVDLNTALSVPGQTDGQLSLSGRGDSESFELADLQLSLLEGSLSGRGDVRWSPEVRGAVMLDGEGLDPAVLAPDFPGDLKITLRAAGGVTDGAAEAEIDTLSISGTFREQPLDVQVNGGYRNAQLILDTLSARSGDTRLSASGTVGDSLDLQWDIDSPDLGDLLPGASGSLAGEGSLAGKVSLPSVRGNLQGEAIAYAEYSLERLSLDLDVDLEREAPSGLELTLDQALLAGVEIRQLRVSGAGNRSDHRLMLALDSPDAAAQLALSGALRDGQWDGNLTEGELQYGDLAAWNLSDPQPLRLGPDEQHLERGCWRSGESRLCLEGQRVDGGVDGALSLDAFGLAYLRPMIPEALSLAGTLGAQVRFRQEAGATPALELSATAEGVEMRTGDSAQQSDALLLGLEPSRVDVTYGGDGLLAEVSMPFTAGGGIDATARVGGSSDPLTERPLRGSVSLALDDIGFLAALSAEIERAAGALNGDVELSGTLAKPVPAGEIWLADGALELAGPGLDISDIGVRVSSNGRRKIDFDGGATSGNGTLTLGGSAQLDGAQTEVDLDIEGDGFEVVNTVDARVFVSPDLKISVRETGIAINGEVRVPRAEITPKELPRSVVTTSTDEVIMTDGGEGGAAAVAQRELQARIRIVLGDAVSIDGFGLKARLAGGLTINQTPGQPTLGSGEVNILDGEYRAYGQGLVIDTGRIVFAGGPISQPGINVRALRRPAEGIVVGVSARGPLQNPDFSVFSEPGMTQSEQLSWLVLGRPLDGASEGESNMIAQAALALGLKGGNFLADRLGGGLGVDSVGIETGSGEAGAASDVNQAAFVIGKYLSPDLFVSYGIGLFDSISTVRLEYSLTDHWKVSTESSTLSSGGDVTYTIER